MIPITPTFRVHTGVMQTAGTLDKLTGDVIKGEYPYLDDLIRLAGKPELKSDLEQLPRPIVEMVGSSTEQDLDRDIMYGSALDDMTRMPPNTTICMNHHYNLPYDLYGSLQGTPWTVRKGGVTDLYLQSDVEILNEPAAQIYLYTVRGRKIGVSGGFILLDYEFIDAATGQPVDDDDLDIFDILMGVVAMGIKHVKAVEFSTVTIPSNQRSWVENAIKGYFGRTFNPLMAPIVRASFPKDYLDIVARAPDAATRKQLEEIGPRKSDHYRRRIVWTPATRSFAVEDGPRSYQVDRKDISALFQKHAPNHGGALAMSHTHAPPVVAKDATGKTDWPLAERDRPWDNGAAHKRIVEWAGGKDDPDVGKLKSVHFYSPDGDDTKSVSKYKLLFCDVIGGDVKAVPRAIFACAGSHGVDATTGVSAEDKAAIKTKIERYYKRMADEFNDDTIVVPWADDKTLADAGLTLVKSADGDIAVSSDGRHAAFSGTHTHAHTAYGAQGGDDMHEHEHTHDGDADHGHSHEPTKSEERIVIKGTGGDIPVDGDGNHDPYTGSHTHSHKALGSDADGQMHTHTHSHTGDNIHDHNHPADTLPGDGNKSAAPAPVASDPAKQAILEAYNALGAKLGFPAQTLEAKGGLVDNPADAQRVISLVSDIDGLTDILAQCNTMALDAKVDELMRLLNVPDIDGAGQGGAGSPGGMGYYDRHAHTHTTKEGKRNSADDTQRLQSIHDHVYAMTDGACCAAQGAAVQGGDNGAHQTPIDGDTRDQPQQHEPVFDLRRYSVSQAE